MADKNVTDRYVDYINKNILQSIDYAELQKSYGTDMVYAKTVLNNLHEAMVKIYGSDTLDDSVGDEGFVVVPGVVLGKESGQIRLALLDLDLSSSGEHWGTAFLCEYGVISQSDVGKTPAADAVLKTIGVYDYCYTAKIPGDIHISRASLPKDLKSVLDDFRNTKPSVLGEIKGSKKTARSNSTTDATPTAKNKKSTKKKSGPEH